jgi:hypothetical protein
MLIATRSASHRSSDARWGRTRNPHATRTSRARYRTSVKSALAVEEIWKGLFSHTDADLVGATVSLALAAVDMALWDLNCKRARIAPPCRGRRPTSHTDLQYRWKLAQFHDWGACRRCDRGAGRGFDASMSFGRMCGGPSALWSRPRRPAMFATCICPWAPESWRSTIAMIVRPFRVEVTERSRSTCSLGFWCSWRRQSQLLEALRNERWLDEAE